MDSDLYPTARRPRRTVNFDLVARPYRWLEYLTFGRLLERRRFTYLPDLYDRKHALLLGDGDGRFLARLLAQNPELYANAVDSSRKMLLLLEARARAAGSGARVKVMQADVIREEFTAFEPAADEYDLAVTHFFLDCFTNSELESIVDRILPRLAEDAAWIVSEFAVPSAGPTMPARMLIGLLYSVFGLLTGLPVRSLPDHSTLLRSRGFVLERQTVGLQGILISELWRRSGLHR